MLSTVRLLMFGIVSSKTRLLPRRARNDHICATLLALKCQMEKLRSQILVLARSQNRCLNWVRNQDSVHFPGSCAQLPYLASQSGCAVRCRRGLISNWSATASVCANPFRELMGHNYLWVDYAAINRRSTLHRAYHLAFKDGFDVLGVDHEQFNICQQSRL
jgi:hypothetical protein